MVARVRGRTSLCGNLLKTDQRKEELKWSRYYREVKPTASMRCEWLITCTCILVCMGLVIISVNQQQVMKRLTEGQVKIAIVLETVNSAYKYNVDFKTKLEDLVKKGMAKVNASNNEVVKVNSDSKSNAETCLREKEKEQHEMQEAENELNKIKETLKAESDAWNSEKNKLVVELTGTSIICNYVKKSVIVSRLCVIPSNTSDKQ